MRPPLSLRSRASLALLVPAATLGALVVAPGVASAAAPGVGISEVAPWGSGFAAYKADWWELTNYSSSAVSLANWTMDDSSATFSTSVALTGISSIAPGESVIFLEVDSPAVPATVVSNFRTAWNLPATVQVGTYDGTTQSVGLSQSGDGVTIFNGSGVQQAKVSFGANSTTQSFENPGGADGTISALSVAGTNGATTVSGETGSPGLIANAPAPNLPEFATPALAALAGFAAVGGVVVVRRRRQA